MARAITRAQILADRRHAAEAAATRVTAATKTLRRPYRSPKAPPTRISAESSRAYLSTTHCTSTMSAWNAACKVGIATLTMVPSMNAMLEARMVAARTQLPSSLEQEAAATPDRITASSQGVLISESMLRNFH